jgi:hypothetical protein
MCNDYSLKDIFCSHDFELRSPVAKLVAELRNKYDNLKIKSKEMCNQKRIPYIYLIDNYFKNANRNAIRYKVRNHVDQITNKCKFIGLNKIQRKK